MFAAVNAVTFSKPINLSVMNCNDFGELSDGQIEAILQLTFQLIASASYGNFSEKDDPSIDVMMDRLGFSGPLFANLGNAYWNEAMKMNPFEAFRIVSMFDENKKNAFKSAIIAVADKDNSFLRHDIARQIFSRTGISY